MMRTRTMFATVAILVAAGCATAPDKIAPANVSVIQYRGLSCEELRQELRLAIEQRDAYIKKQKSNRTRDGLLNALVLPGAGAITSDNEDNVARTKGLVLALEGEIAKRCKTGSD